MKLLEEFRKKPLLEEEKSDYSKFDTLVRAGLANKAQMQRIHKILDKMQEERPQFNNADRMILQNLFNKMVDLISNNKTIYQQARRAVSEELEESAKDINTSDFKLSASGRKVRAHRFKVGDKVDQSGDITEETILEDVTDLPNILVLKRVTIRHFGNKTKVALYYNQKLDKYFSIPYGDEVTGVLQAEETEQLEEAVMDQLHKIVAGKQAQTVKFGDGSTRKVDHFTASAITQVHKALNDENKKKFADMVHKSPAHLAKASDFAFKHTK
jgi:hypothetical protein